MYSEKFDELNERWILGWIMRSTLKRWVAINNRRPGAGITAEEYEEITGEAYSG